MIKLKSYKTIYILTLNDKLGDSIIFNFSLLSLFLRRSSRIRVYSPHSKILNENLFELDNLDEVLIDKDVDIIFNSLISKLRNEIDSESSFIFIDTLSFQLFNRNKLLCKTKKFNIKLKKLFDDLECFFRKSGMDFFFWRDPFDSNVWGMNNFKINTNLLNTHGWENFEKDYSFRLQEAVSDNVNVYKIMSEFVKLVFNEKLDFLTHHLTSFTFNKSFSQSNYCVLNLTVGSVDKLQYVEKYIDQFLNSFFYKNDLFKKVYVILEEKYEQLINKINCDNIYCDEISVVSYDMDSIYSIIYRADAIYTYCSGFSHVANIFSNSVTTFTFEDNISLINGRNPWAPQRDFCLKDPYCPREVRELIYTQKI